MKRFLAVVLVCLPAFGQATYSGMAVHSGSATYVTSSSGTCAAPNFCAYTGADIVPWGTVPDFGGITNNNATAYDTSYLGHTNFDGSAFSNSALLSPITRLTDSVSAYGRTNANFTAGMGGSGVFTLTNTNTSLVRIDQNSAGLICLFNTSGPNQGHCGTPSGGWSGTPPSSGIFITTGQLSGGSCTSNCPVNDFGPLSFSLTDPTVLYTFGNNSYDITTPTTVTPYAINLATGSYSVGSPLVDFQYGLPIGSNAPNWTANTFYAYGAYVTHVLNIPGSSNAEYLAYNASTLYNPGDIIVPGGAGTCMYRAIVGGTTNGTLATSFFSGSPCKNDIVKEAAPSTLQWRGTNSAAQFVYQNTGTTGTSSGSGFQWVITPSTLATDGSITSGLAVLTSSSNPFHASQVGQALSVTGAGNSTGTTPLFTTILSYQNAGQVTLATPALHTTTTSATVALTGHPDVMSSSVGDSNGIVWTNVGPSYAIANGSQLWRAIGGISRDTAYSGHASKYGIAISTNSYGLAPTYSKYAADQGTGAWGLEYDAVSDIYHLLNTLTGIWTDWSCSSGSGYACPRTATTVGVLTAFSNPLGTGQACPFYIHNLKLSSNGSFAVFTNQADVYAACTSLSHFGLWQTSTANFDGIRSFQFTFAGINHWAIGTNKMVAFNNSGWGYTSGVFLGVYNANNAQGNNGVGGFAPGVGYSPPFSVYLSPLASQSTQQTTPPGCYVTSGNGIHNPDCNLSEILDSHLSWVGDPGTDTYPACGTSYNYATLGPAFNAWQNMETCYQTSPTYPTGYAPPASYTLPSTSVGNVWQFTHTFATGTSSSFSTQFQISEYSQDANWLFWSSDWDCQNGSTDGSIPVVNANGFLGQLPVTPVPASPTSFCGLPWQPLTPYVLGNLSNPIEGTSGSGLIDDVFQAIAVNGTGTSGPSSALPGGQPQCGTISCFANTNPPGVTRLATNGAMSVGSAVLTSTSNPFSPTQVGQSISISGAGNAAGTIPLYATITSFQNSGQVTLSVSTLETGGTSGATVNLTTSAGDTVCDSSNPTVNPDVINPSLPYSASCPNGIVWQDVGPQNQRGDVFAVNLGNQR